MSSYMTYSCHDHVLFVKEGIFWRKYWYLIPVTWNDLWPVEGSLDICALGHRSLWPRFRHFGAALDNIADRKKKEESEFKRNRTPAMFACVKKKSSAHFHSPVLPSISNFPSSLLQFFSFYSPYFPFPCLSFPGEKRQGLICPLPPRLLRHCTCHTNFVPTCAVHSVDIRFTHRLVNMHVKKCV